ncbi:hypothetical protein HY994_01855 [Candidatus Micrarchaeota archaeon]|nr:hypothetical protein [Candidatus Micrarchaeota archaeon]
MEFNIFRPGLEIVREMCPKSGPDGLGCSAIFLTRSSNPAIEVQMNE